VYEKGCRTMCYSACNEVKDKNRSNKKLNNDQTLQDRVITYANT